jgi:hypothetical protein
LSPVAAGNQVPALVFLVEFALHHDTNTAAALPVMLMSGRTSLINLSIERTNCRSTLSEEPNTINNSSLI